MRNCSGNSYYGSSHACSGGLITGNSVDVNLNQNDSEVRVDIDVARINTIRIWGQVLDCDGTAISNALVKLVKPISVNGTCEFQGVAHCVSDCNGFYQFDVPSNGDYNYKILVGKSAYSNERIICGHDCNPCNNCNSPKPPCQCNNCNQPNNSYIPPCDSYASNCEPARPTTDPCCNNYDSCCNNYDSCCNNYDPCCNNYDPCCNNYDSCCNNHDSCCNNHDSCCNNHDSCKSNYESYGPNCEPCNQNYDSCSPSYKVQNTPTPDCCDGDNKYATYYYSEPEVLE